MYGGKALKTAITVIALAAILIIVTYLVFVEWLPAKPAVEEHQVKVEETGETVKVESWGPHDVKQEGDEWITVEGVWGELRQAYVGDLFIRFEEPPKHLKLLVKVEKGPVKAEVFGVLKSKGPEWTPIYELVFEEGEYTVDVYFNDKGPEGFLKSCAEKNPPCKPAPGRIYKVLVNGEEAEYRGDLGWIAIPHIGGQDKYWHLAVYFTGDVEFLVKIKVLEKE